jgi:HK97 family phage major capsid protein
VSPGVGGTLAIGDPFLLQNALPARHSAKATFASNIAIINKNRQNAYAQNSANSIWTDLGGDIPAKFLGRNYVEASAMSSSITTGQDVLLYGNFEKYYICDVIGSPQIEYIANTFDQATGRPSSQRGFLLWFRQGGDTVDPDAFRLLRL